jgi:hypothetical protein
VGLGIGDESGSVSENRCDYSRISAAVEYRITSSGIVSCVGNNIIGHDWKRIFRGVRSGRLQ